MTVRRAHLAGIAIVTALFTLAACGGGSSSKSASATTSGGSTSSSSAATATSVAGPTCGDTAATVKQHLASSDVTEVKMLAGCTSVAIDTSLDDTAATTAQDLCVKAAEVAYTGSAKNITVLAKSKRELAIGIKGSSCIGEP